jgi:hypothetical protein
MRRNFTDASRGLPFPNDVAQLKSCAVAQTKLLVVLVVFRAFIGFVRDITPGCATFQNEFVWRGRPEPVVDRNAKPVQQIKREARDGPAAAGGNGRTLKALQGAIRFRLLYLPLP